MDEHEEHQNLEIQKRERKAMACMAKGVAIIRERMIEHELTDEWCNEVLLPIQNEIESLIPVSNNTPTGTTIADALEVGLCGFTFSQLSAAERLAILQIAPKPHLTQN